MTHSTDFVVGRAKKDVEPKVHVRAEKVTYNILRDMAYYYPIKWKWNFGWFDWLRQSLALCRMESLSNVIQRF
jgi:hypothetical protein